MVAVELVPPPAEAVTVGRKTVNKSLMSKEVNRLLFVKFFEDALELRMLGSQTLELLIRVHGSSSQLQDAASLHLSCVARSIGRSPSGQPIVRASYRRL
jgi:hypothetical protein